MHSELQALHLIRPHPDLAATSCWPSAQCQIFFSCVLIYFSNSSAQFFLVLALFYPCSYSFLLSWLPFLAISKIPLVNFSSVSGHICIHAHTHSIKVKNSILVLTVAIKRAPTKCCHPLIIWLLTHSIQAALPLGFQFFLPDCLWRVCVRSRMEGKCETEYEYKMFAWHFARRHGYGESQA